MRFWKSNWFLGLVKVTTSLAIIAAGGLTFFVFGQKPEIETKKKSSRADGVLVETAVVEESSAPISLSVDGEATTYRIVDVGVEVSGRIAYKSENSRSGHYVKKGDVLFRINDENYQIAVESQKALLEQIDEEIRAHNVELDNLSTLITLAQEDLQLQNRQLERTRRLYERNATTDAEFDAAKTQELNARNALQRLKNDFSSRQQDKATAEARLRVAAVELRRAELDLARCTITASIEGRIVDDLVEQGNFVSPGQTLTRISDASQMEIRCQLQANEVAWIWEQEMQMRLANPQGEFNTLDPINLTPVPIEVVFEFGGVETIWEGTLSRFAGSGMSRDTRTFPARVTVEHPEQTRTVSLSGSAVTVAPPTLISGMFVEIRIPIELKTPLLVVPQEAVRPGGKLWLAKEDHLQVVDVAIAKITEQGALLRPFDSVKKGDRVIISPISSVIDGMPIHEASESEMLESSLAGNDQFPAGSDNGEIAQ